MIPADDPLADKPAAERYLAIHAAVAATLAAEGIPAVLSSGAVATGSEACFENPVTSDITDAAGRKLGGAGQRRTRDGVLHQGSVLTDTGVAATNRSGKLASQLAELVQLINVDPDPGQLEEAIRVRYGNPAWTRNRSRTRESSGGEELDCPARP